MGDSKRRVELMTKRMLAEVESCFTDCQGMRLYSTEESDRYWEMSEKLMRLYAEGTGRKLRRKKADG